MSTVTWLHLSDIHFNSGKSWRDEATQSALLAFLKKRFTKDPSLKPDFIVCTGDIAFGQTSSSPLTEQYDLAAAFFDDILQSCECDKEHLFVVPGNHDINRQAIKKRDQRQLQLMADSSADNIDEINQDFEDNSQETQDVMKRLAEYNQFIKSYLPHQHDEEGRCCYSGQLTVNDIDIGIAGLNSAWSCSGDKDKDHLWLAGQWQFNRAQKNLAEQHIKIALMHHPIDWLAPAENALAKTRFASDFHFMLHGHTHDAWVDDGAKLKTIAAGATGADDDEEFGFNITQLNVIEGTIKTYLYGYSPKKNGWMIAPDPHHADEGIWEMALQKDLIVKPPVEDLPQPPQLTSRPVLQAQIQQLYGREKLLNQAEQLLKQNKCLLVYGMRGNGKSVFIEQLGRQETLKDKELIRIQANATTNAGMLYLQLANMLGDKRENVSVPNGSIEEIIQILNGYKRDDIACWLWFENAHKLFENNNFKDLELRKLLLALREVLPNWHWIFELRERPVTGLIKDSEDLEMPGLDKATLAEFLLESSPTNQQPWEFKGDKLKSMYQWLGGGHGHQAHPQATRLLIEVAKGHDETPYQVLRRRLEVFEQELEDFLLNDLYHQVLNREEQLLFATLALYRVPVPTDHIELLEEAMTLSDAWEGLNTRCLLSISADGHKQYLHGFIAGWLRQQQGYALEADEYREMQPGLEISWDVINKQRHIADCWVGSVKGRKRVDIQNITRANEALFHLIAAGEFEQLKDVAVEMLGADIESVYYRVFKLYEHLHKISAPLIQQRSLLTFLIQLKPEEAKLYRFLGSNWRLEKGWKDKRVLENFKKAVDLNPDRPECWSSYGKACLKQKLAGQFVTELALYEQASPSPVGINDFVLAVKADCLKASGDDEAAFMLRQQQITSGSQHPALYAEQALAYQAQGKWQLALDVLALAQQNSAANDFIVNIKANILNQSGDKDGAMVLRQQQIDSGSKHPSFYTDQAQAYLAQDKPQQALEVLALAQQNDASNEYSLSIKAHALDQSGLPEQAMILRQQQIDNRTTHSAFYVDQAEAYLKQNQPKLALEVLQLAEKLGASDKYIRTMKIKVMRQLNEG
ncbi:MAG: putative phosphodiesterase/putative Zn-dependent protease [Phenylobacterium sp.]|jgi:predicted phosphodiesterase/predicted Zn-dependent protease